jgi:1-acyl-sn-glycerol-3-phosphate acyltransferase
VVDHNFYHLPIIKYIFRIGKCISIAPEKENAELKEKAFDDIAQALEEGYLVGFFPEGKISYDGDLNRFMLGLEQVLERTPVPVIPIAIQGMWGSFFSRKGGRAMSTMPKPSKRKIKVRIDEPINRKVTAAEMQVKIQTMLDELEQEK